MLGRNLLIKIKKAFSKPDEKKWLHDLIKNIEHHYNENKSIGFKIVRVKEKGFVVKVSGLYGFIFFNHMPWQYCTLKAWQTVAPFLIGKVFFGKVHKITKDPLSIILDGNVKQFSDLDLYEGEEYTGLVIQKSKFGVFIDIGYHFHWIYGSFVGLLHKSQFSSLKAFVDCQAGSEVQAKYQGLNSKGQLVFGDKSELLDWVLGIPQKILGQQTWAKVIKDSKTEKPRFLVQGIYKGTMIASNNIYPKHQIKKIRKNINELSDGEVIRCEVLGFNDKRKILNLRWIAEFDIDNLSNVSLMNILDDATINKLKSLHPKDID